MCMGLVFVSAHGVSAQMATNATEVSVVQIAEVKPVGFFDRVRLFFTFNAEKKADLLQDFSGRSFALATQKIEQGDVIMAESLLRESDEHLARASVAVSRIPDLTIRQQVLSRFSDISENRVSILQDVQSRVESEQVKQAIDRAMVQQEGTRTSVDTRLQSTKELEQKVVAVRTGVDTTANVSTTSTTRAGENAEVCDANTAPWIKVVSPNGGEEYSAGENITVEWETCNISETRQIFIQLRPESGAMPHNIINAESPENLNDGEEEVQIPGNTVPGQYRMRVGYSELDHTTTVIADSSDGTFTIAASGSEVADSNNQFSCPGISIASPQSNTQVTFPLTVQGVIHPTSHPGPWVTFEGEAGHVIVKDGNGNVKSNPVILNLNVPWMNLDPKPFSVIIPSLTSSPYDQNIWLHFSDNNPMDNAVVNTCVMPLSL